MSNFQGKGDWQRPTQVSMAESDLRWELMSSKTTQERKEEILLVLECMKEEKK